MEVKDESRQHRPLTESELIKIAYSFSRMSTQAKNSFIVMMITKFPDNFEQVIECLGEQYDKCIARA